MVSKLSIKQFKKLLEEEMSELVSLSKKTERDRAPVILDQQSVGRLSRMDAIQQQNMSIATEKNRKERIVKIENALKRIENGDFGFCVVCGEEIFAKRLLIDPTFLKCIECN